MASNLKYAETLKNVRLDAITAAVGIGGLLRIYSGKQPVDADTKLSDNVLLAQLTLLSPFAEPATRGMLTANAIEPDPEADNTGTAIWGSLCTAGGRRIVDFTVGTKDCDLNLNTVDIVAGAKVSITALTITSAN